MAVSHVGSTTQQILGLSGSTSHNMTLPTNIAGDYMTMIVLGTPDADPTITMPSGWVEIGDVLTDVTGVATDLYIAVWGKVSSGGESSATVTWSSPLVSASSSSSTSRVSLACMSWRGQILEPTLATTNTLSTPASPYTPAGYTTLRTSSLVTVVAQRNNASISIATANGWTSHLDFTPGGVLARTLNVALITGQAPGTVTMPTYTVNTSLSTSALASLTFDLSDVPLPSLYPQIRMF